MPKARWGSDNHMWKGGRSVASNGYVLIRVGVGHHLADSRGYAYEHRLVAERMLGRRLQGGEEVHHVDRNRQNNAPENLEVLLDLEHGRRHWDPLTAQVLGLICLFPGTRGEISLLLGAIPRQVGWALQRLKRLGYAQVCCQSWAGTDIDNWPEWLRVREIPNV